MQVDDSNVPFSSDQQDHHAERFESSVPASHTFGSLNKSIRRLDKTIGLSCLRPSTNAMEMLTDRACDLFYGVDLQSHHADLLWGKDGVQLFYVHPGERSALNVQMRQQFRQRVALCHIVGTWCA